MSLSKEAKRELVEAAASETLRKDMQHLRDQRHNPFLLDDGRVDIDAYIDFLNRFNEFINHEPKPLKPFIEKEMKL